MNKCVMCGKEADVSTGWHLKGGFDFCGNACVADYIEGKKTAERGREVLKCPRCNNRIKTPYKIRIYIKDVKGKIKHDKDISYCCDLCRSCALIFWKKLVIGCHEYKPKKKGGGK